MPKINLGKVVGDKGDPFTFNDFTPEQLDGITPKLLKGNVTTLDPDENVIVDIRKDGVNNYIDFGIPRGKNGAEIKKVSASNVELSENNTLDMPIYDDSTSICTTLSDANNVAEESSSKIKSGTNLLTTLSNIKKSFSAIVQGLKILGTNVGAINGITSDINSESTTIAASSKMVHDLNASLSPVSIGFDFINGVETSSGVMVASTCVKCGKMIQFQFGITLNRDISIDGVISVGDFKYHSINTLNITGETYALTMYGNGKANIKNISPVVWNAGETKYFNGVYMCNN